MKTNFLPPPGESKTNTRSRGLYPLKLALLALAFAGLIGTAKADIYAVQSQIWGLNNLQQYLVGGVQPAVLPGVNDTILISTTAATWPLGGSLSISNLTVDPGNTGGPRIGSTTGATLTIGSGGIIKTYSANKLELSCNLALSANQTWTNAGNNIQVDSSAVWTFNGYTLTMTGGGTFDNRSTVNCGTNVNIQCASASMNATGLDMNLGSGRNSFKAFTLSSGTVEGNSFPADTNAATTSAFGNCLNGTGTITMNGGTLVYNGSTTGTPEKINMNQNISGANAINVSTSGATLTLTNLLFAGSNNTNLNQKLNFSGAGNLTFFAPVNNYSTTNITTIVKNGAGTLTLSGTNKYSGSTLVNGGTLALTVNGSISNTPVIQLAGGTKFDVSGLSSTFVLQSGQAISNNPTSLVTLAGNINSGSGTFAVTFYPGTAPLTITNGVLTLAAGTVFNLTSQNPRLSVGGIYPLITPGPGGSVGGTVPYSGTGSLSLGSTGTGHLAISGGTLNLVVDTATLPGIEPLHWTGSGSSTWDVANSGNNIWKDSTPSTPLTTYFVNSDSVQFDEQYISANQTVTLNTTVSPNSTLVSNANYSYTISGTGTIGGSGSLTKLGSATLILGVTNTSTGGMVISNGIVQMGNPKALGPNGGTVFINSGAVLDLNGTNNGSASATNILTLNGAGTGAGALINSSTNAATFYGPITLSSASTISSPTAGLTLAGGTITGNYPLTLGSGNISLQGSIVSPSASLIVSNGGTLYVQANSYGGGTYLVGGQLLAYNTASFGTGPIYLGATSGSVAPNLSPSTVNSTWNNPVIVVAGSSGTPALYNHGKSGTTWAGSITLSNNLQMFASGGVAPSMSISGPISGPGGVVIGQVTHNDAIYFSNTNTYTGPTYVNYANLLLTGNGSVSNSAQIVVSGGESFDVSGLSSQPQPYTLSAGQTLANALDGILGQTASLNGNMASGSGTLLLTYDGSDNCFNASDLLVSSQTLVIVNPTTTLTVGNIYTLISGIDGASTLPTLQMLRGAGTLQISGGSLQLTVTSTATPGFNEPLHWAGTGAGLWQTATPTNVWKDSSTPAVYNGYSDLDPVQFDEQNISANQVVTLNGVVTPPSIVVSNSTDSYTIIGSGAIGGTGTLTKTGPGTFTLANSSANFMPNTYSGATTVSNGTLMMNSTIMSPVTLNGGVLSGLGTISNTVTVNSVGTLVPGTNGLTTTTWLTIYGNLTLNPGSTTAVTVVGGVPAVNLINMPNNADATYGTATYGGTLSITPAGTFHIGDNYTLFQGAGTTNASNFASITGSPGAGMAFAFTNGILSVVNQPAPSPTNIVVTSTGPNSLSLNWPSGQGWQLQSNSVSLVNTSAWQTVTGATPPYPVTISPNETNVFYRLKY